jgi:selenoprotein W-related protein
MMTSNYGRATRYGSPPMGRIRRTAVDVTLEYCALWNYEPQAVSLTAKLLPRFKRAISRFVMIPSTGGCFELTVGGKKLYSKLKTGTFPDEDELVEAVGKVIGAWARSGQVSRPLSWLNRTMWCLSDWDGAARRLNKG